MRVLVTGAAGYLGSVLCPALIERGHAVIALDSFMYDQGPVLAPLCPIFLFDLVRGDARDEMMMTSLIAEADVIIPLAAIVGAPACNADWLAAESVNTTAVHLATKLMSRDQRMILPITNSGYGIGEAGKECTEDTPMRPISLYGQTKVAAEEVALAGGNAVSLRLATVFGMSPRMRLDLLVNDFVWRAVTDRALVLFEPHFKRNYIHVRDVARAFLHAIDNFNTMRGRAFNVGLSDANISKLELCQRIQRQVPGFTFLEAPIGEDPDKRDYVVSNARIEATGFEPMHSLDSGIAELIKGYRMLRKTMYGNV